MRCPSARPRASAPAMRRRLEQKPLCVYGRMKNDAGSACPALHTNACTLEIGALIVIRGQDPAMITNGTIIIFRPYPATPDYLVVHRVVKVYQPSQSTYNQYTFWTE